MKLLFLLLFLLMLIACSSSKEIQTKQVTLLSWKPYNQKGAWVTVLDKADTLILLYTWYGHSPRLEKGMCLTIKK